MKSLRHPIQLRAEILTHLEEANSKCNLAERRSALTFVVGGGSFAGVHAAPEAIKYGNWLTRIEQRPLADSEIGRLLFGTLAKKAKFEFD